MPGSLPDRPRIAGVSLPDRPRIAGRSPPDRSPNRAAVTNNPVGVRANPRTARGRRVRDLYLALVERLSDRDPVAEAQALKIAELVTLAEEARARAAEMVDGLGTDAVAVKAFATMINAVTRAEGTARRAMIDFKGTMQARPKPSLLQQKLKAEGRG